MDFSFSKLLLRVAGVHLEKLSCALEEFTEKEEKLSEEGRDEFGDVARCQTSCLIESIRNFCAELAIQAPEADECIERMSEARLEMTTHTRKFCDLFDSTIRSVEISARPREVLTSESKQRLREQLQRAVFSLQGLADVVKDLTTSVPDESRRSL